MTSSGAETALQVVLDTSAYSRMRVGHEEVLDRLAAADVVWLPSIVLGELEAGFELGGRQRENRVVLAEFLAEPFVGVLEIGPSVARRYGKVFAQLRRDGTPIPINDVWIAACTLDSGAQLVTLDHHFARVRGLDVAVLDA
jgi:tRNA(fMet)-specific endonuclease VapC